MSLHQSSFQEVLSLAQLSGSTPEAPCWSACSRRCSRTSAAASRPWCARAARGARARAAGARRLGRSRPRRASPARPRPLFDRASRSTPTKPGARARTTACRVGDARSARRCAPRGSADMCIGIPMQVRRGRGQGAALVRRPRRPRPLDMSLVGDAAARHLASHLPGRRPRGDDAEEAAQTDAALDALAPCWRATPTSTPPSPTSSPRAAAARTPAPARSHRT